VLHGVDQRTQAVGKWRLSEIGHVIEVAAQRRGGASSSNPFYNGHFAAVLRGKR
jgi:hypothetical protein